MKEQSQLKTKIKKLFSSQKLGVLATSEKDGPYTSLIAFAATSDLKKLIFATPKDSHKFMNITSNPNVSFFIDNRKNKSADFKNAIGVTVIGAAKQIKRKQGSKLVDLYLEKHSELEDFIFSRSSVIFCIEVDLLYIVEQFQKVSKINP